MSVHWQSNDKAAKVKCVDTQDRGPGIGLPKEPVTPRGKRRKDNGVSGTNKQKAKLAGRVSDYEKIKDKNGFCKPGSVNKRK